jgi:hypothetical protein
MGPKDQGTGGGEVGKVPVEADHMSVGSPEAVTAAEPQICLLRSPIYLASRCTR